MLFDSTQYVVKPFNNKIKIPMYYVLVMRQESYGCPIEETLLEIYFFPFCENYTREIYTSVAFVGNPSRGFVIFNQAET